MRFWSVKKILWVEIHLKNAKKIYYKNLKWSIRNTTKKEITMKQSGKNRMKEKELVSRSFKKNENQKSAMIEF